MKHDRAGFKHAVRTEDTTLLFDLHVLRRLEGALDLLEIHDARAHAQDRSWLQSLKAHITPRCGSAP